MYAHITLQDKIMDVIKHPAFEGYGQFLFPWDDERRYDSNMTMADAPSLLLWHTNMDSADMVRCLNILIDEREAGRQIFYDFYDESEKRRMPSKRNTGLFFLRGRPGAPFAVVSAGGGFCYVGSLHGGFPPAEVIRRHGYNVFVLKYRVGNGELEGSLDLIAAVDYIQHARELEVLPNNYSLWGGSAGARIAGNVCYGDGGIARESIIHPAICVMAYTTFAGQPNFESTDSPGYMIAGDKDWIVPANFMPDRARAMRRAGIPTKCIILKDVQHGFGTGVGMQAEGWIEKAINFWEKMMKNTKSITD